MLGKDHEGDRHIGHGHGSDIAPAHFLQAGQGFQEDQILCNQLIVDEGFEGDAAFPQGGEFGEVQYEQRIAAGALADESEDRGDGVACKDADDEGDQAEHFLAVGGAEHGDGQRDKPAQHGDKRGGDGCARGVLHAAGHKVADGVSGQRKADDGDGRPNDHDGHELLDPANTGNFNDNCNQNVDKSCQNGAYDQAGIAERHGHAACKRGGHAAEEGEGAAEEDRAAEFGEKQVDECADACAQQRGGGAESAAGGAVDDDGHDQCRGHDGQKLLNRKDQRLAEFRLVLYSVDHVHCFVLRLIYFYCETMTGFNRRMPHAPSYCGVITRTCSSRAVGTFFPTYSGLIGSSLWPRSTMTARRMRAGRPI